MRKFILAAILSLIALPCFAQNGAYSSPSVGGGSLAIQQGGVAQGAVTTFNCSTNLTCSVAGSIVTVTASGSGGATLQTNGTGNTSQLLLNFTNSSTNAAGFALNITNPSGGVEKFEITGTLACGSMPTFTGDVSNSLCATTVVALNGTNLAALATGLLYNTTSTGVPSIATSAQILAQCTGCAPLASPTFTGTPSLPTGTIATTQAESDSSTKLATTAFVANIATLASLSSVGTIGTGVWHGTIIGATYGGTGVNNGSATITLGSSSINLATFTTGFAYITTTTGALTTGTASQLTTLVQGLTGCNTAGFVYTPQANDCVAASGSGTVTVVGAGNLTSTALVTGGGSQALQTPSATATLDTSGDMSLPGTLAVTGHVTLEGVTSTGATGTGALVFGTAPTVTLGNATGLPLATGATGQLAISHVGSAGLSGVSPISVTSGGAISLQNATPANITSAIGTDTAVPTAGTIAASALVACTDANSGVTTSGCVSPNKLFAVQSGTGVALTASTTKFLVMGGIAATENLAEMVIPYAAKFTGMYVAYTNSANGASTSQVWTLRTCTPTQGTATCTPSSSNITCTVGNSQTLCNDTSHTLTVAANDYIDLQEAANGGSANTAQVSVTLIYQ